MLYLLFFFLKFYILSDYLMIMNLFFFSNSQNQLDKLKANDADDFGDDYGNDCDDYQTMMMMRREKERERGRENERFGRSSKRKENKN